MAQLDVAIVGAGFAGIAAARAIASTGRTLAVFERASGPGGVWRRTVYPGAACDVPSNLYSLADFTNPDWATTHAHQPEMLAYLTKAAAQLEKSFHYSANVERLRWRADEHCWDIVLKDRIVRATAVLLAVGPQSRPRLPDIDGLTNFTGQWLHTADWDATVELAGANVLVVGSGSSAVQVLPHIAAKAAKVTAIQRSAAWVLPRKERPRRSWEKTAYSRIPMLQALSRTATYWLYEILGLGNLGNWLLRSVVQRISLRKLAREVDDPTMRQKLLPDYPIGCKRVTISDDYWPTFNRENVTLKAQPLRSMNARQAVLADGTTVPADIVVFATGYDVAGAGGYISIEGLPGYSLPDLWLKQSARAYLGTVVAGFPNLGLLLGPNSGLSHSSAIHVIESQLVYIRAWLDAIDSRGALVPRDDIQQRYNEWLDRQFRGTVWEAGCSSWFIDQSGRNTVVFPGLTAAYRRRLSHIDLDDFRSLRDRLSPVAP